jgi:type II secretory pathway pseudopilin PulG
MLSGFKFTVIFLSIIILSVIMLSVIMLSVVMLIVVAPLARAFSRAELESANQQKRVIINFIIQLVACTIKHDDYRCTY